MRKYLALAFTSLVVTPLASGAQAQAAAPQDVTIQQWQVPFPSGQPRDPFVAPDGRIWFVGQRGNYLAVFDPRNSEFKQHALPDRTNPHTNIVTPDGIVWVAGNVNGTIVRFDPKNNSTKIIPVPKPATAARATTDPHTMIYDGKGGIWFTMQNTHFVGHLEIATEKIQMVATGDSGTRSGPYGIILDPSGRPYFDLFHTNKIGSIDPATMKLQTFDLPEGARPRRIARTSDGAIWYTDYARGFVGRLDPRTGGVDEYAAPSGASAGAYAMTVDDGDRVWFTETGVIPNRMVAIDGKSRKIIHNSVIPGEGRNSVRHMVFDPKTRLIWYGADLNFLGSVKVPPKVGA